MRHFAGTAQRLAARLRQRAAPAAGHRQARDPGGEAWASVGPWIRFAAAGILIAWLLSLGVFGP
jgi:hypothetical protein